jgi:hypothetical protein
MKITLNHICWMFIIILILIIFIKLGCSCNRVDRFQVSAGLGSWFNEKILGRNQAKRAPLSRADRVAVSGPTDAMLTEKSEINAIKYATLEHRVNRLENSLSKIYRELQSQTDLNSVSAPPQPARPLPQRRAPPIPPREQVEMRRKPVAANADDGRGDLLSEIPPGTALRPLFFNGIEYKYDPVSKSVIDADDKKTILGRAVPGEYGYGLEIVWYDSDKEESEEESDLRSGLAGERLALASMPRSTEHVRRAGYSSSPSVGSNNGNNSNNGSLRVSW